MDFYTDSTCDFPNFLARYHFEYILPDTPLIHSIMYPYYKIRTKQFNDVIFFLQNNCHLFPYHKIYSIIYKNINNNEKEET